MRLHPKQIPLRVTKISLDTAAHGLKHIFTKFHTQNKQILEDNALFIPRFPRVNEALIRSRSNIKDLASLLLL